MGVFLVHVGEMPVAALQGEAVPQAVKSVYNIHDGIIDHVIGETCKRVFSLFRKRGVMHQFPRCGERFHGGFS
jgi:hypothetical protein